MCIEEHRTVAEPVEELEEVILDNARPERTTRVETLASVSIRQARSILPQLVGQHSDG